MTKDRLSSDNLYHFKSNVEILKSILTHGFRHNLWEESIPYKKSKQSNFMVCFCDIRIEESDFHRQCYGNNAIVLTKEWGIKNGVSPVRYIHKNSQGVSQNYLRSRDRFRSIREAAAEHTDTICMDYAIFSILSDLNKLKYDSIEEDIAQNSSLQKEMENLEQEFTGIIDSLKGLKNGQDKIFTKFWYSFFNRLVELHNELEQRDSYMRVYSDDFKTIQNKILYDEKEWRSIKYADKSNFQEAVSKGFLPPNYNLTFTDCDLLAILVEDQQSFDNVESYLKNNNTLLDTNKTLDKLEIITNYKERT